MDRSKSRITQNSGDTEDEVGPNQFLPARGRTPSPPWKSRCFVYDCGNVKLEVHKKEEIEGSTIYSSSPN